MNKQNFELLIAKTREYDDDAACVDLPGIWATIDGSEAIMQLIDRRDQFRGMCMWLGANSDDTNNLQYIAGYAKDSEAFIKDYLNDNPELVGASAKTLLVDMLETYRDNIFTEQ